jgi:hypothetical protein
MRERKMCILDVAGRRFHLTSTGKALVEEAMANLRKYHPTVTWTIEPFYVNIKRFNPDTNIVTDWTKEVGWSLWYSPVDALENTS